MRIVEDDLEGPEIAALLGEHVQSMRHISPPDSVHTLSMDKLRSATITVWTAWDGSELLGCGALQELDAHHGEIKSMRTATPHLGKGVGATLLNHMLRVAGERGYKRVSLETGSAAAFRPAHSLYRKFGFEFCGPFGDYVEDPHSYFMTLTIS